MQELNNDFSPNPRLRGMSHILQNKMQNFKDNYASGCFKINVCGQLIGIDQSSWVGPLTQWCTPRLNNELTRRVCKAEIS